MNPYSYFKRTFAPGESQVIYADSRFFTVVSNSIDDHFLIRLENYAPQKIPEGFSLEIPDGIRKVTVTNPGAVAVVGEFCFSFGRVFVNGSIFDSLKPGEFDDIKLSYTGDDLTKVEYFLDGSVIKTLNLSYLLNQLQEVTIL